MTVSQKRFWIRVSTEAECKVRWGEYLGKQKKGEGLGESLGLALT